MHNIEVLKRCFARNSLILMNDTKKQFCSNVSEKSLYTSWKFVMFTKFWDRINMLITWTYEGL